MRFLLGCTAPQSKPSIVVQTISKLEAVGAIMQTAMSIHGHYGIVVPEASVVGGESISSGSVVVQATHIGPQPCLQGISALGQRRSWV